MSDCPSCPKEHICDYEYKPCDCVNERKFKQPPDLVRCPTCEGDGYKPYPIRCKMCNTSGWVRSPLGDTRTVVDKDSDMSAPMYKKGPLPSTELREDCGAVFESTYPPEEDVLGWLELKKDDIFFGNLAQRAIKLIHAQQSQIDALMLEWCPNEMSKEQMGNWAKHQAPAEGLGEPILEPVVSTLKTEPVLAEPPTVVHSLTGSVGSISRGKVTAPTEVLCIKDGEILQLWHERGQDREWRLLPSFEEASKAYKCTEIVT